MNVLKYLVIGLSLAIFTACGGESKKADAVDEEQSMPETQQEEPVEVEHVDYDTANPYIGRVEASNTDPNLRDYYISVDVWVPAGKTLGGFDGPNLGRVDTEFIIEYDVPAVDDPSRTQAGWMTHRIDIMNNSNDLRTDADADGIVHHSNELETDFTVEVTYGTNATKRPYKLKDAKEKEEE